MMFLFDEKGNCISVESNYGTYYYQYNAQGDVTALLNSNGSIAALYCYDAWGKIEWVRDGTGAINTDSFFVGNLNPFRYKGYYYDTESGLYYLNSRYYDPVTGRFINADGYADTGTGVLGSNMYTRFKIEPHYYTYKKLF